MPMFSDEDVPYRSEAKRIEKKKVLMAVFLLVSNRSNNRVSMISPQSYAGERTNNGRDRMKHIVIGVAGGSGSGKTTLAQEIFRTFAPNSLLLCHDYYYKSNPDLPFEERAKANYDHPDSFETQLLVDDIKKLKRGESILHPTYNYSLHLRDDRYVKAESVGVIVVEGILIFDSPELCDLFDVKLYVDTDADVRFIRRLQRDVEERGRSMRSIIAQYYETVKPMHEQFVEPSKRRADIIIPEGGKNPVAVEMIINNIRSKLLN